MRFRDEVRRFKKYRDALMDASHRGAFAISLKVWSSEMGAMSYADILAVLDIMAITTSIDNRKLIMELVNSLTLQDQN